MFDFFHLSFAAPDAIAAFQEHLPIIGHVQIAGVPDRQEPDQGARDYRAVLAAIEASGYGGWVGAEYHPRGDTDAGLAHGLRRLASGTDGGGRRPKLALPRGIEPLFSP